MLSVKVGVIVVEYLKKAKEKLVDTIRRLENPSAARPLVQQAT